MRIVAEEEEKQRQIEEERKIEEAQRQKEEEDRIEEARKEEERLALLE